MAPSGAFLLPRVRDGASRKRRGAWCPFASRGTNDAPDRNPPPLVIYDLRSHLLHPNLINRLRRVSHSSEFPTDHSSLLRYFHKSMDFVRWSTGREEGDDAGLVDGFFVLGVDAPCEEVHFLQDLRVRLPGHLPEDVRHQGFSFKEPIPRPINIIEVNNKLCPSGGSTDHGEFHDLEVAARAVVG